MMPEIGTTYDTRIEVIEGNALCGLNGKSLPKYQLTHEGRIVYIGTSLQEGLELIQDKIEFDPASCEW